MVLRWTGAAMLEAAKGFRRLKVPASNCRSCARRCLRSKPRNVTNPNLEQQARAA
jgi:hypothetical protein